MDAARRWGPPVWALALALLMLGPALRLGYVLSYDMVWVPDLALRSDFLGVGSQLPRAVPSDALVSVVDELVPGMLLQKLVLLAALAGGGAGAALLAPAGSLVGRLVAVTVYQWNPFTAERLAIGHWPVLLGYAALPWVVVAAQQLRRDGRVPVRLWWLVPLGSLSAGAGLVTAVGLLAFGWRRGARRADATLVAVVLAGNAPWVVSGLLHHSAAVTDAAGAGFFALQDAGPLPAPVAALGLGGIWNVEVLLPSREGAMAVVSLAVLALLCAVGVRAWAAALPRRDVVAFVVCWAIGWGTAVLTWALPDAMAWSVAHVPGAGLLRDGSRVLALCAPLLAALAGYGAATVTRKVAGPAPRASLGLALLLAPVATMPDAAFGESGRLQPVDYPASYLAAADLVGDRYAQGQQGDVLVLPLTSYRAPAWNDGRKVLDPMGRLLPADYVASDELSVSGRLLAGEDPRVREVAGALAAPTPAARSRRLAEAGIGLVVEERDAAAPLPELDGRAETVGDTVTVLRLDAAQEEPTPVAWWVAMAIAWTAYAGMFAWALVRALTEVTGTFGRYWGPSAVR